MSKVVGVRLSKAEEWLIAGAFEPEWKGQTLSERCRHILIDAAAARAPKVRVDRTDYGRTVHSPKDPVPRIWPVK